LPSRRDQAEEPGDGNRAPHRVQLRIEVGVVARDLERVHAVG
jgi:hypothetical protein